VLDHCGKPPVRQALFEPWRTHIRALAAFDNVCCKISGLLTEAGRPWRADVVSAYIQSAVEAFGMDRVLFGSDWPVVTLAAPFRDWYDLTWSVAASWSTDEQRSFYHDNALRYYGLRDDASTPR
jgi:L-fuconolactonase